MNLMHGYVLCGTATAAAADDDAADANAGVLLLLANRENRLPPLNTMTKLSSCHTLCFESKTIAGTDITQFITRTNNFRRSKREREKTRRREEKRLCEHFVGARASARKKNTLTHNTVNHIVISYILTTCT